MDQGREPSSGERCCGHQLRQGIPPIVAKLSSPRALLGAKRSSQDQGTAESHHSHLAHHAH